MFKIQEDSLGKLTQMELTNVLTGEYVTIIHDYGTCINELVLKANGKNTSLLLSSNDAKTILNHDWFKGAKLSPFPNRVKGGKFSFNGTEYQLPTNDSKGKNALHGFIFNKAFELDAHNETPYECSVEFSYAYNGKSKGFPFPFKIRLAYIFSGDGLECETTVTNMGTEAMPMGDGFHPYFKTGTKVDRLQLCLPKAQEVELGPDLIPTGKLKPFNDFEDSLVAIGSREFDTCLALDVSQADDVAHIELYDPDRDLFINLWQETGAQKYNYLQLYIPADRQSIAIEPMTCAPDALNNGMGLITLEPGEKFSAKYGITLK